MCSSLNLILKIKDIAIFVANLFNISEEVNVSVSFLHVIQP